MRIVSTIFQIQMATLATRPKKPMLGKDHGFKMLVVYGSGFMSLIKGLCIGTSTWNLGLPWI